MAFDMFSGPRAPVACALAWCGWAVEPIDILISKEHDLSCPQVQNKLSKRLAAADAQMWAPDCSTLSRARERPIPGHSNPPQPLRGEGHVRGLPGLGAADAQRVSGANSYIDFTLSEVAAASKRGAAVVLESPLRSWLWQFQQVGSLRKAPGWRRVAYDACCWGGARCKAQALEGNLQELADIQAKCHHSHDKDEWRPTSDGGRWRYPSHGEAEYTAELAFRIAVSMSWWAVRVGRAKLRVPWAPQAQEAGNRVGWAKLPPEAMRQWAMPAVAVRLGLTPPKSSPGPWFPADAAGPRAAHRLQTAEVGSKKLGDASDVVYAGSGADGARFSRTEWASPFVPGTHGTHEECATKYITWYHSDARAQLRGRIEALAGKAVVCECPYGTPCHADFLVAQVRLKARGGHQNQGAAGRRGRCLPQLVAASLLMPTGAVVLPPGGGSAGWPQESPSLALGGVPTRWPQWSIDAAVRSLFPPAWTSGVAMPQLDDLVNSPPFTVYADYLEEQGLEADGPLGPTIMTAYGTAARRASEGDQKGHFFAARALPQVVPLGASPDEHFRVATEYAKDGRFPLDEGLAAEQDLQCAASWTVAMMRKLPEARGAAHRAVQELIRRCKTLSEHLRKWQSGSVAQVAAKIEVGFLAVATVLLAWPDTSLPKRYVTGFSSVGVIERTGVLRPVVFREPMAEQELLARSSEAFAHLGRCVPEDDSARFLKDECVKDYERGFAGPLLSRADMDRRYGEARWLPMPRFEVVQASGKRRPIDDGKRFGHNEASGFLETIECCSATQPATHLRALYVAASQQGAADELQGHRAETGGEDMPDAYRWVPADPKEAHLNVVAVYDCDAKEWVFQVMHGQVFGRAAAVVNFHRVQRIIVAMARRWLHLMASMYYDDATLQDLGVARGRGQRYLRALFRELGLPLAEHKQVDLNNEADFLGLTHDVSEALSSGELVFEPRKGLLAKAGELILQALHGNVCTPAQASKIRGVLGFVFTGTYGRVGRGGQQALLQRQYVDTEPFTLSHALRRSLRYLLDTLQVLPQRRVRLCGDESLPIIIASDGRADESGPPSVGVVLFDPQTGRRCAVAARITGDLLRAWGDPVQPIALVEQAAVLLGVCQFAGVLRGRPVLWFEDNAAVLAGLVKGSSSTADLDQGVAVIHLLLAALQVRVWFEYVESAANWSDGVSRELEKDPWAQANGFPVAIAEVPLWPWTVEADYRTQRVLQEVGMSA